MDEESPWPALGLKRDGNRVWFSNRPDLWLDIEYGIILNRARRLLLWERKEWCSFVRTELIS